MLKKLIVKNIALVSDAELEFSPLLTVLSGETGAGKTALLFALRLLVGERSDSSMIRDGATFAMVEAEFVDLAGDASLHVRRRIESSGRSRCYIDDKQVSVSQLAQRIGPLLDLHGQHEHQSLLDASSHVRYFDSWIGTEVDEARHAFEKAFDECNRMRGEYEALQKAASSSVQEREVARIALREIDAVDPQEGEYETIESQLPMLEHADALATAASEALEALRREHGAEDSLAEAHMALTHQEGIDSHLDELAGQLSDVIALEEETASALREYRDSLDFDPETLQSLQERLSTLDGICKRFGPRMSDVLKRAAEARSTLELAEDSTERLDEAKASYEAAETALDVSASRLADVRMQHADDFTQALARATDRLAMQGASFTLAMSDLPRQAWTREGSQHIELLYSPGPTITVRPLAKIASGGELSRVMLALISEVDLTSANTLVFDEVDAGIDRKSVV